MLGWLSQGIMVFRLETLMTLGKYPEKTAFDKTKFCLKN